ncbi:MAG: deoxyribonuclease IV, partial [bacterium]
ENTAVNDALLGRDFAELGDLIDLAGGGNRLGLCIDTCHLHASGYDVKSKAGVEALVDEMATNVGVDRLSYLHVNDSRDACGSNRDRHANIGEGEIGKGGFRAFLSEPRLQGTPAVLETPGRDGQGSDRAEVSLARRLWREGLRSRKQGASQK